LIKINYYSETQTDYKNDIDKVKSLEDLKKVMAKYKEHAIDAFAVVQKMDEARFKKLLKSIKMERRKKFANDDLANIILCPMPMLEISMLAMHCHAPYGTAWIRAKELGALDKIVAKIKVDDL